VTVNRREDFFLDIARGVVPRTTHINKFGCNTDVDASAAPGEDIWDGAGSAGLGTDLLVLPTVDRIHALVSSSGNDDNTPPGSGARAVTVQGISGGVLTEEVVELNGASPVNTTNAYGMIHRMFVTQGYGSGVNAGNITATAAGDGTVTAQITVGYGQTLMAVYQIPAATTGYLTNYYAALNAGTPSSTDVTITIQVLDSGESYRRTTHLIGLTTSGDTHFQHAFDVPVAYAAGATVFVNAVSSSLSSNVSAGFDMILVQDE
jgi:hypothetical protein